MGVSFKQREAQKQRVYCLSARGCQVSRVSEKSAEPSKVVELGLTLSSSSSPSFLSSPVHGFSWSTKTALPQGLNSVHHLCFYCSTCCEYALIFKPSLNLQLVCFSIQYVLYSHCRLHGFTFLYSLFIHLSCCHYALVVTLLDLPAHAKILFFLTVYSAKFAWQTNRYYT